MSTELHQQASHYLAMWNLVLYIVAVAVGLALFFFYEPSEEKPLDSQELERCHLLRKKTKKPNHLANFMAVMGLSFDEEEDKFEAFKDHFSSFEEVSDACRKAGLEESNLVIGVDFTASNEWQGRRSFNQNSLHKLSSNKVYNPYQKVIWILGQTLKPFDEDNLIPAYGFGDAETTDENVFNLKMNDEPCTGLDDVLEQYSNIVRHVSLSGPTSFAPVIKKTIDIVIKTGKYHILVIIADGQLNEEAPTIDAIVESSDYPISIIVVGVGDGPWNVMEDFDRNIPKRKFDNFHFVDYHSITSKAKNPDTAFALHALMEIPDQFKTIKALGYLKQMGSACDSIHAEILGVRKRTSLVAETSISTPPRNYSNFRCSMNKASVSTPV